MREQHLSDWWWNDDITHVLPDVSALKEKALSFPVSTFIKNAQQVHLLSMFPINMFRLGAMFNRAIMTACHIKLNDAFFDYQKDKFLPEARDEILSIADDILQGRRMAPFGLGWIFSDYVFSVCADENERGMYDTLMSTQLVLGWTAFETLAGDLWEAAINTHCPRLVNKAWEGKSIPFESLRVNEFDLKSKMGTVLRDHLENPFQSLNAIKNAYQGAFSEGWVSEDKFWSNKDISSTFQIRNLIVHRAGIVDDKFRKDCASDSRIVCPPIGERFYLDGKLLPELLTGLFSAASKMIQSVDGYVSRHK